MSFGPSCAHREGNRSRCVRCADVQRDAQERCAGAVWSHPALVRPPALSPIICGPFSPEQWGYEHLVSGWLERRCLSTAACERHRHPPSDSPCHCSLCGPPRSRATSAAQARGGGSVCSLSCYNKAPLLFRGPRWNTSPAVICSAEGSRLLGPS